MFLFGLVLCVLLIVLVARVILIYADFGLLLFWLIVLFTLVC